MSQKPDDVAEMKARLKAEAEAARTKGDAQEDVAALKARLKAEAEMLNQLQGPLQLPPTKAEPTSAVRPLEAPLADAPIAEPVWQDSVAPLPGMKPPAIDPEMEAQLQAMKEAREAVYASASKNQTNTNAGGPALIIGLLVFIVIIWMLVKQFVPATPPAGSPTTSPITTPSRN